MIVFTFLGGKKLNSYRGLRIMLLENFFEWIAEIRKNVRFHIIFFKIRIKTGLICIIQQVALLPRSSTDLWFSPPPGVP